MLEHEPIGQVDRLRHGRHRQHGEGVRVLEEGVTGVSVEVGGALEDNGGGGATVAGSAG